ncbi:nodal modulator 1-like [Panonychus citri]|uniref:nodal modulator 1-like n=1 Tax=Panonychus citri TaxID=50023 RepID=UPI00230719C9|nr:nodal modulator 1-like [Panonychus citri]
MRITRYHVRGGTWLNKETGSVTRLVTNGLSLDEVAVQVAEISRGRRLITQGKDDLLKLQLNPERLKVYNIQHVDLQDLWPGKQPIGLVSLDKFLFHDHQKLRREDTSHVTIGHSPERDTRVTLKAYMQLLNLKEKNINIPTAEVVREMLVRSPGRLDSHTIPLEIEITKSSGKDFVSHSIITSKSDGTFCSFLEPGKYRSKPIIPVDQENELVFTPKYLELLIEEKSKLDLTFHQFAASVSGSLILKEPKVIVNDISIDLILDDKTIDSVQPDQQSKEFKFKSIAPGKYRLRLRKGDNIWCWKEDEMTINILDEDLTGIKFTQIGYYLTLVTSHPVKVTITHTTSKKSINAEIKNVQQPFRQCLLESGRYEVNTVSCHSFKNDKGLKEPFIFDTRTKETSSSLIIRAYKHQLTGSVTVTVPVESSEEFVLSLTRKSNINDQKGSTNGLDYLPSSSKSDNQGNLIKMFKFSLFAEPNELLTIVPSSTSLLFKPPKFEKTMGSDCLLDAVSFKGRSGLFIKGSISPPLMDATIKLYSRSDDQLMYETVTDAEGKYTAGPFDCCDAGITIDRMIYAKAEKVGYLLKESSKFGQFVSEKLSSLIVKVTNADGSPLPEVLISISGGSNNFRKNLITPATGELSFIGLNPGEYFMRSVLKEFKFDPASRIVDIKQGESVTLNVKGERVAYSCYGSLTSMSEEPEANILVEAVGIGGVNEQGFDCKQLQEEVTSESNGNFRIRDLKPGCNYRVSVKKSNEQNLIARSLPENVIISVGRADVTGIKLILFTRSNTMELTGDIITNPEFWPSLRVKLFSESIGDQLLASIPVTSGFFSIPTQIPVDNRWYILKLESTLPTYLYYYETASLTFQANTTYSHFQFQFDPKQSSNSDSFNGEQDNISTGSLFTLPLFLLLGLIIYKFDKVKPIFDYVIEKVWSTIHPDGRSSPNSDGSLRRKIKSRRT